MENIQDYLSTYGEDIFKALGLNAMRHAYGTQAVNYWYTHNHTFATKEVA